MFPVYLISYNRLTTLRTLVEQLKAHPVEVVIVDNASTYPPLLDYLRTADVRVIRLPEHLGKHCVWQSGQVTYRHFEVYGTAYYAVSDPDLDIGGCPGDLFDVLRSGLERYPDVRKCGTSLEIDDLPEKSPFRDAVRRWEGRFWTDRRDDRFFNARLDTTLAVYHYQTPFEPDKWTRNALRSDRPYTARHVPWYVTPATVTEEDAYYERSIQAKTPLTPFWRGIIKDAWANRRLPPFENI